MNKEYKLVKNCGCILKNKDKFLLELKKETKNLDYYFNLRAFYYKSIEKNANYILLKNNLYSLQNFKNFKHKKSFMTDAVDFAVWD